LAKKRNITNIRIYPEEINGTGMADHEITGIDAQIQDGLDLEDLKTGKTSRRDFLKVFGFSLASTALLAACKRPVHKALPYIDQPPEITPGKSLYYATSFYDGHEYSGIIVKTRDGRPIKIEGNSLSPFNGEGTTARVQASVLSLYDDSRLKSPSVDQKPVSWDVADNQIINELAKINSSGGKVVLLTSSIISPSTVKLINEFGAGFGNFEWVRYDSVSYSAIIEANSICFHEEIIPDLKFQNADIVVSINADFLGTWLSPVHFIPGYVTRRKLDNGEKNMLRHIQFESGMSLTGSNADKRLKKKSFSRICTIGLLRRPGTGCYRMSLRSGRILRSLQMNWLRQKADPLLFPAPTMLISRLL
jgi:hypothetical protein